tara:strand:+ start:2043 stop:2831 length:789 start_codon:yes stop_codon:yes gene_type:complete
MEMSVPSSFCSISTIKCGKELLMMLKSLEYYHPNSTIYLFLDTETDKLVSKEKLNLQIVKEINLDEYAKYTRDEMEKCNIFTKFLLNKPKLVEKTLTKFKDTLLLDADVLLLNTINDIDHSKDIGVSPHFIKKQITDKVGYYNVGFFWIKNINVINDWIELMKTSRYFEQTPLEDLVKKYTFFEFGEEYNLMPWRQIHNDNDILVNIQSFQDGRILYKNKDLKLIHTHFNSKRYPYFDKFNNCLIEHLKNANRIIELKIIEQ